MLFSLLQPRKLSLPIVSSDSCDETAVAVVEDGRKVLSDAIASRCGFAAVFSGNDTDGYSLCLCGDAAKLGTKLKEELGARCGGKPGYFQGSVKATRGQIEEILKELR